MSEPINDVMVIDLPDTPTRELLNLIGWPVIAEGLKRIDERVK